MKKMVWMLVMMLALGLAANAPAEEKNSLSDFTSRLQKGTAAQETAAADTQEDDGLSFGPSLRMNDPFFQKVRSSAYLQENDYSREANVMIELRNVSGRTLYPKTAKVTAYNAAGEVIEEETYSSCSPEMVADGASLFVWDWFYGFDVPVAEISYFGVEIETETSSYKKYANIASQSMVSGGIGYALVENGTESDIYGLDATIVAETAEGVLLDVCEISTGNACGIFPGSVMILRANLKDYANDAPLADAVTTAYAQYELD